MQFMLLIYTAPGAGPAEGSPEAFEEFGRWLGYTAEMKEAGAFVAGDPLQPIEAATTVRVREGETLLADGPFAETKETLGGYYVVEAPDLDGAVDWAARMPNVTYGSVEVRPVIALPVQG